MLLAAVGGTAGVLALGMIYEAAARRRERRWSLPGQLIEVEGSRLHVIDKGQGAPTVVVIHGAGDSSYSWTHVLKELARHTRVITYDRPGMGSSEPGPGPDAVRSVTELHTLLTRIGAPRPYVLVGHSLGGLIARLYAVRHPKQVAGMVMVDSSHESLRDHKGFRQVYAVLGIMLRFFRVISPFGVVRFLGDVLRTLPMYPERPFYQRQLSGEEYRQWTASFYRHCAGVGGGREFKAIFPFLDEAARQMKAASEGPQFGNLPMVVLSNPGFGEWWVELHRELAGRSANSIHRISDHKGHSLQMPRPDLVIDAVSHVVEQVRRRAGAQGAK